MCINAFANLPEPPGQGVLGRVQPAVFLPQAEALRQAGPLHGHQRHEPSCCTAPTPDVLLAVERLTLD